MICFPRFFSVLQVLLEGQVFDHGEMGAGSRSGLRTSIYRKYLVFVLFRVALPSSIRTYIVGGIKNACDS